MKCQFQPDVNIYTGKPWPFCRVCWGYAPREVWWDHRSPPKLDRECPGPWLQDMKPPLTVFEMRHADHAAHGESTYALAERQAMRGWSRREEER